MRVREHGDFSPFSQDPKAHSGIYLQCWALAGTRSTPWLAILLKMPSGNPGFNWAPSKAGTLCFFLTTGTTLKRIFLQPLDTSRERCGCPSFRLAALSEPATACRQSGFLLLDLTLVQDTIPAVLTVLSCTCRPSAYPSRLSCYTTLFMEHCQVGCYSILHTSCFPREPSLC